MNYNGYNSAGTGLFQGINQGLRLLQFRDQRARQAKQDQYVEEDRATAQADRALRLEDRERLLDEREEDRSNAKADRALRLEDRQRQIKQSKVNEQRAGELHSAKMENSRLQRRLHQFNFNDAVGKKKQRELSDALTFTELFYESMEGNEGIDQQKFLESMNGLFDDDVGAGKKITGIYPHEDKGVMLQLGVDDGKGGQRTAPMTQNRSDAADDPVMVLPWNMMFNYASQIDEKLKEAGYDMSSQESRQKAFDAFHALAGNGDRREKRAALDAKNMSGRSSMQRDIDDIMENYRLPSGEKPTYTEAFHIAQKGRSPQVNPETEFRQWSKLHQDGYRTSSSGVRRELKAEWEQANPGEKFTVTKWAKEQARASIEGADPNSTPDRGDPQQTQSSFPDASQYDGKVIRQKSSGKVFTSINGQWVETPENGAP